MLGQYILSFFSLYHDTWAAIFQLLRFSSNDYRGFLKLDHKPLETKYHKAASRCFYFYLIYFSYIEKYLFSPLAPALKAGTIRKAEDK